MRRPNQRSKRKKKKQAPESQEDGRFQPLVLSPFPAGEDMQNEYGEEQDLDPVNGSRRLFPGSVPEETLLLNEPPLPRQEQKNEKEETISKS